MAVISDSFTGPGVLDNHLSNQGKSWVSLSGSMTIDASGLTNDASGTGKYYLDDSNYAASPPARVNLNLNLPTVPTPDEAISIWLFVFGTAADGDSENYLQLLLTYLHGSGWAWEADSIDAIGGFDFTTGSLADHPSQISIDPVTQKFYVDSVLKATLTHPPTWGANARPGLKTDFVAGVNVHMTSIATSGGGVGGGGGGQETTSGGGGDILGMHRVENHDVIHRDSYRAKPVKTWRK